MKNAQNWIPLFLTIAVLFACERSDSAAAKTPNETSNDRVEIVSILPEAGTVLKVGDVVTVEVDVEYGLAARTRGR